MLYCMLWLGSPCQYSPLVCNELLCVGRPLPEEEEEEEDIELSDELFTGTSGEGEPGKSHPPACTYKDIKTDYRQMVN